jgi:hypothetical protein
MGSRLFWECPFALSGAQEKAEIVYETVFSIPVTKYDYMFLYCDGSNPKADDLDFYEFFSGEYIGTKRNLKQASYPGGPVHITQALSTTAPESVLTVHLGYSCEDDVHWWMKEPRDFEERIQPFLKHRDYIASQVRELSQEGRRIYAQRQQPRPKTVSYEEWSEQSAVDRLNNLIGH